MPPALLNRLLGRTENRMHSDQGANRNLSPQSQAFLNLLLGTLENRVNSDQGANCMICLEDYNTLNTSTGVVEWEVRLPCGHQVGSSCIVSWLEASNNCPLCRLTFFPGQPRPYLEHGIMDAGEPIAVTVSGPPRPVPADTLVRNLCTAFGDPDLPHTVGIVARSMARLLMRSVRNQTHEEIAAASIYIASHLVRQPKSPLEIAPLAGVSPDQILSVYSQIYPNRMQFIAARDLERIAEDHVDGMLAFLPPPDGGNGDVDDGEERREFQRQRVPLDHLLDEAEEICFLLSEELGRGEMGGQRVNFISRRIASEILLEGYLGLRSPPLAVATGLYMASHLLGHQASSRRIADLAGINEGTLRTAYTRVYPLRGRLIKPCMLSQIGLEDLPRALEALPALNWPPL
ncbi:MAG: hypothetical protein Q9175_001442 [Cornicularia normoerica]